MATSRSSQAPFHTIRQHLPEYLIEAVGLGLFMISASIFTILLEHPASLIHQLVPDPLVRRSLIGLAMGLTAIALTYSPWGKQSGAHFNPVLTLTFFRLGKVKSIDVGCYVIAQFIGGCLGMLIATQVLGDAIAAPAIRYVITTPGKWGVGVAFLAELIISFGLMLTVLTISNHPKLGRFTGLFAGALIMVYITVEAPFSGMSMNPARTFASAIWAQNWTGIWLYFIAPLLGMFGAAELYLHRKGRKAIGCAKLHHQNNQRCIFCCSYQAGNRKPTAKQLSDKLPSF